MKFEDQILIGELALKKGFITEEQLEECIAFQEAQGEEVKLGEILIKKGYLKKENLPHLISIQADKMDLETWTGRKRRDSIFGRIAVRKDYCTDNQVNECLRYQAQNRKNGIYFTLGEYMFRKGYLSEEQVQDILSEQGVKILICSECQSQYNIVQMDPDEKFTCRNCHQILEVPKKLQSLSVIGSISSPGVSVGVLRPPKPWFLSALIPLGILVAIFLIIQIVLFSQREREISDFFFQGEKACQRAKALFEKEQNLWDELAETRLNPKLGEGEERDLLFRLKKNRQKMVRSYYKAWEKYQQVQALKPQSPEVRSRMADVSYAFSRLSLKPLEGEKSIPQTFLSQLSYFDEKGRYLDAREDLKKQIRGQGYLYIDTEPSGATIAFQRWNPHLHKWISLDQQDKVAPFSHNNFTPGSYLLTLKSKAFAPVLYPVYFKKNDRLIARIRLLRKEQIPSKMVYIPGGRFLSGPPFEEREVSIGGFLMDRFEVTHAQYTEFLKSLPKEEQKKHRPQYQGKDLFKNWTKEDWDLLKDHPVLGISYESAVAYAKWRGKRLPLGMEWEKAARSVDGRLYPWGWKKDKTYACTALSPRLRKRFPFTFPIGDFHRDKSVYGCFDLAGNLSEWVLEQDDFGKVYPAARGGNYRDHRWEEVYSFMKGRTFGSGHYNYTGFRCAMDLPK